MVKFDEGLNVLTVYELTIRRGWISCQCFRANRETCRHRQMIALFVQHDRVDKGWFYDYGSGEWLKPLTQNRRRNHAVKGRTRNSAALS
jgi:hypothetical protein